MNIEIEMDANLENITEQETEPVVVQTHRLSSIIPIIVLSYIGVLIRLGFAFLGNNETPVNAAFWPNFVGCLFMGFIVEQKIHIQTHFSQLYMGLTTGLCGSITTFSGLMYNSCVALFGPSSQRIYPVSNYIVVMISAFSASFIGFIIGRHVSLFLFPTSPKTIKRAQYINDHIRIWLFPTLFFISIPLIISLTILLPVGHYTYFIYSVLFAPFGSLTRYILSVIFNKNPDIPLGTFLANAFGSYLYLGLVAIQQYDHNLSLLKKQIILSFIQGYCGCLTTVSTFLLELNTIKKRKYVYLYFFFTVLPVQIIYIILGDIFHYLCSPS